MRVLRALFLFFIVCALQANAQTEQNGKGIIAGDDASLPTMEFDNHLMADSANLFIGTMSPKYQLMPTDRKLPNTRRIVQYAPMGAKSFNLWHGGHLDINGATNQMPGLMDYQTGSFTLHQDFGRLQLSASATANKYWMPMQSTLYAQYGFGASAAYTISEAVTLHAYGQYYANNPIVGPAFSPYVSTTTYGGYADVHINDYFGSNVGVRRYLNPMSGRWTTEPIVTPYIKVKKSRIEFPVGSLLKTLIWGDRDNPLRFQPRPMPVSTSKQK
jgi:hypothetical protein